MHVSTIALAFREINNTMKGKARKLVIGTVALNTDRFTYGHLQILIRLWILCLWLLLLKTMAL